MMTPLAIVSWRQHLMSRICVIVTVIGCGLMLLTGAVPGAQAQECNSEPSHFEFASGTEYNYSLVVQQDSSMCELQPCDEIGVFDGSLCVGATVFEGTWPIGIVASQDDDYYTPDVVDGYIPGNQISFRIWRSDSDTETSTNTHFMTGNGTFGDGPYTQARVLCGGGCCIGRTGNIDCDIDNIIDLGDLTMLINHLFINFPPLCCPEEANCDGMSQGGVEVDLGDLTALIDYLFITFTEPSMCN